MNDQNAEERKGAAAGVAAGLVTYQQARDVARSQPTAAPITAPEEPEIYRLGHDGMAREAFPQAAQDVLRRKIDPNDVEIKPDGIVYLPGVFYRSRLNEAFGPGAWAMPPRGPARRIPKSGGEVVMFNGVLFILGRFVAERIGQCMYYPNNAGMTYADAYEGAITDCLGRCCKDIMPGVEVLWDPGWRGEWQRMYAEKGDDGKWRRKPGLRMSKLSPNAIPSIGAPGVGAVGAALTVAAGVSQSVPLAPSANASGSTESDADTGEVASDAQLDAIEALAFDALKWPQDIAQRWLFTEFGTRDPGALTAKQAIRAVELLQIEVKK